MAGCFLSGDGYDPSAVPLAACNAVAPLHAKRVKSETNPTVTSVTERRRRSGIEVQPLSTPVAGKKSGREGTGKRVAEEDSDLTLCGRRISHGAVFLLHC